jgi:hypothetical protein
MKATRWRLRSGASGEAMGLGQASVHNTLDVERELFIQCLDRYLDTNMRSRITRVEKSATPGD